MKRRRHQSSRRIRELTIKKERSGRSETIAKSGAVMEQQFLSRRQRDAQTTKRVAGRRRACISSRPATVMKLLEIVRGKDTAPDVLRPRWR